MGGEMCVHIYIERETARATECARERGREEKRARDGTVGVIDEMFTYTYIHTCMYTYIYVYLHPSICTYVHVYMHMYMRTCMHTYILTNKHTYIYIHAYIFIYICTHTHTYIYTYVYICIYICIHIYRETETPCRLLLADTTAATWARH